ncbi:hypothetical protein [Kingella oralis]|uniref:hypothetical protein n=1 Tax=Kingella oralis TaxID=505 RepID=UPI002D7F74DF|nr:hypothetical protein [Kingella oralis]
MPVDERSFRLPKPKYPPRRTAQTHFQAASAQSFALSRRASRRTRAGSFCRYAAIPPAFKPSPSGKRQPEKAFCSFRLPFGVFETAVRRFSGCLANREKAA